MNWILKARLQNFLSFLPKRLGDIAYFELQLRIGGFRNFTPIKGLSTAFEFWEKISENHQSPKGKTFFEVGTGWTPLVPIGLWLMGAGKIVTVDLNRYLSKRLLDKSLIFFRDNPEIIHDLLRPYIDYKRFEKLINFKNTQGWSAARVLNEFDVYYQAPFDARNSSLKRRSVDYHISNTVFEHIPKVVLVEILKEARRIINTSGMAIHRIDYTDHFSHSDSTISPLNFLKFDDSSWARLADNRFMYMNRMRHQDYIQLFEEAGFNIKYCYCLNMKIVTELLKENAIKLDSRFETQSLQSLETTGAWILAQ